MSNEELIHRMQTIEAYIDYRIKEEMDKYKEEIRIQFFEPIMEKLDMLIKITTANQQEIMALNHRMDRVENRLDKIEDRIDKIEERLDRIENRVGKIENYISIMKIDISTIKVRLSL